MGENFFRGKKVFPHTPFQKTDRTYARIEVNMEKPKNKKFLYLPTVVNSADISDEKLNIKSYCAESVIGKYPCPCCGYKTLPVPKEDAIAYICPVCYWENDVFIKSDDEPSDENGGMTLNQARENYKKFGICEERFVKTDYPPQEFE